ncbi:plasmid maintenance protein CcdB, partial [Streptococcus sp. WM07]
PQISSVPEKHLRNPIGTLVHFKSQIMGALELAVTGI